MSLIKKYKAELSEINDRYRENQTPLKNEDGTPHEKVLQRTRGGKEQSIIPNPYYVAREQVGNTDSLDSIYLNTDSIQSNWLKNTTETKSPDSFVHTKNPNEDNKIYFGNDYYERATKPLDSLYFFKNYVNGGIFDGMARSTIYFLPPTNKGDVPKFADALYGNDIFLAKELGTLFGTPGDRSHLFIRRKYAPGGRIFSNLRAKFIAAAVDTARVFAAGPDTHMDSILSIFSPRKETAFYNKDMLGLQVIGSPLGQHLRMRTALADFYARPKMGKSQSLLPTAFINSPSHFFQATPIRFGLGALNETLKLGASLIGGGYGINQSTYETVENDINYLLRNLLEPQSNFVQIPNPAFLQGVAMSADPFETKKGLVISPIKNYFEVDEFGFRSDKINMGGYKNPVEVRVETKSITGNVVNNFFSNFANLSDDVSFNVINFSEYDTEAALLEVGDNLDSDSDSPFEDDLVTLGFVYMDKNLNFSKHIQFRAFLTGLQETVNPDWNVGRYIGHPLTYHTYKGVQRTVVISFNIHAYSKKELASMWIKLNKLSSLCYPQYSKAVNTEQLPRPLAERDSLPQLGFSRMQAPIIRMHVGSMYKNIPGRFDSITYTVSENTPWETEGGFETPHIIEVVCNYVIIGHVMPELDNINSFDVFRTKKIDATKGTYSTRGQHAVAFQENKPKSNIAENIISDLVG